MIRFLCAAVLGVLFAGTAAAVDIREVTSPGGIRAWLVEEHSIPFTALELRFEGGTSLDRTGKRGAVLLMTALIEEGAGDFDSQSFAAARDALAAEFSFDAFDDAMTISAQMLSENRAEAVELLRVALNQTRFDQSAIDRVRGQIISMIQSEAKDPGDIANRAFDRAAFGDHPYGSARTGTLESVAALTRDDLMAAKSDVMTKDRLTVSAVGDITEAELGELLDILLGNLPADGASMPALVKPALTGGVTTIDYASPQSVVVFGHKGIRRDDPDFFAAYLLNQILGGRGFGARLMEEVREKRGLTYGIGTYLAPMNLSETWQGSFSSANEKVAEAIDVVRAEWARAAAEGVSAEELETAKTYLTGSYPLRFDGNGPIANILVGMQSEGLPISYVNDRNAYIEAVTVDDIKRVAAQRMKVEDLRFVVVGQPVGLDTGN
ncbi:MAG: pitrilysin family protein [Albidovulum sp.]